MERHPLASPPSEAFLNYLAGFIDADGCVRISGSTAYVSLTNRYLPFLLEVFDYFGGNIRLDREVWRYEAHGPTARRILNLVKDRLWEKQEQAQLVLCFSDFPPRSSMREAIKKRVALLKRTIYPANVRREGL